MPPIMPTDRHCARYKFSVLYCIVNHVWIKRSDLQKA